MTAKIEGNYIRNTLPNKGGSIGDGPALSAAPVSTSMILKARVLKRRRRAKINSITLQKFWEHMQFKNDTGLNDTNDAKDFHANAKDTSF